MQMVYDLTIAFTGSEADGYSQIISLVANNGIKSFSPQIMGLNLNLIKPQHSSYILILVLRMVVCHLGQGSSSILSFNTKSVN